MLDEILQSRKLERILEGFERRELKTLKKLRDNYYDVNNLFNMHKFEIGDIIYLTEKFPKGKEHNKVTPCKIMSKMKTTTRNSFNFIDVKLLNVKSHNGKENTVRVYFLDFNIEIDPKQEENFNLCFVNKKVAEQYIEDYDPKTQKIYKLDKKRLKRSYKSIDK